MYIIYINDARSSKYNEIYLLIKYIKSVLWRLAKCLSYIEEARCLKVNLWTERPRNRSLIRGRGQWNFLFFQKRPELLWVPHSPLLNGNRRLFNRGQSGGGFKIINDLHILLGLIMSGVILLPTPTPRAFMACAGTFIVPASWIFIDTDELVQINNQSIINCQ